MYDFIQQVRNLLVAMGITKVETSYSCIEVGGCDFYCQQRGKSIRIDGASISKTFRTPASAVEFIIEQLPKMMENKANHKRWHDQYEETRKINSCINGTNCRLDTNDDTWVLTMTSKDKLNMLAAIDYLQDGGFCEISAARMEEEDFTLNQTMRLMNSLTKEQKQYILNQLAVELED